MKSELIESALSRTHFKLSQESDIQLVSWLPKLALSTERLDEQDE